MKQLPILLVSSAAVIALVATLRTAENQVEAGKGAAGGKTGSAMAVHVEGDAALTAEAAQRGALRAGRRPQAERPVHVAARLDKEQLFKAETGHERRTLQVPRDFLDKIVRDKNREVAFTAPGGVEIVGSVKHFEKDADGVLMVSGAITSPREGAFYFRRQKNPGVSGAISGFARFPEGEISYRMEPAGPGGEPALVERMLGEIMCLNYAPSPREAPEDGEREELPATHPAAFAHYDDIGEIVPLESLPGATGVIYLDFDGEVGPFPGWDQPDEDWPGITFAPHSGATSAEIKEVWERVAEDFQPFNLNVTTDQRVYDAAPEGRRIRVIITPIVIPGLGGIAFFDSFNWEGNPVCWAFATTGKNAAEVVSHEVGHTLNLEHHGIFDEELEENLEYYEGHGSGDVGWAPIMGVGYERNLTQWSKGEYDLATNPGQDDLETITTENNDVDYRDDDFGAGLATAAYLEILPDNRISNEGIIERTGDVDAFRFRTTGGAAVISAYPVEKGANLDIQVTLHDSNGVSVGIENPISLLYGTISRNLTAGEYVVRVTGTGWGTASTGHTNYGSLGGYRLSGVITGGEMPDRLAVDENQPTGTVLGSVLPRELAGLEGLSYAIESGNEAGVFEIDPATGEIFVADGDLLDYELHSPRWDRPADFQFFVRISNGEEQSELVRTVVSINDINEAPVVAGATIPLLEGIPEGTAVHQVSFTEPDRHQHVTSYSIISGNTDGAFSITDTGVITVAGELDASVQSTYELVVRVRDSGTPSAAGTATITLNVLGVSEDFSPGRIRRLLYNHGGDGTELTQLTNHDDFPNYPFAAQTLTSFSAGSVGPTVGSAIVGYLIPTVSGDYRFWITANYAAELRLSPSEDPAEAEVIDEIEGTFTNGQVNAPAPFQWTTEGSETVTLEAGKAYFIEARHVQRTAEGGHVSVAWEGPDIEQQVIPGMNLAPANLNYAPRIEAQTLMVRRGTFPGGFIGVVEVSDFNSGDSHGDFQIVGGSGEEFFSIEAATGVIRLVDPTIFADGEPETYELEIETMDNGEPPLIGGGTVTIQVVPNLPPSLVQEIWTDVEGEGIDGLLADPRYPLSPDVRRRFDGGFDSGGSIGTNYGSRVRGFVIPPASGSYVFHLSGDDEARLLLGTSEDPASAREIARIESPGIRSSWSMDGQKSAPVSLVAGRRYYIETLQRQTDGNDFVQVSWTGPGIAADGAYQFYRFQPTKTRNGGSRVHLGEMRFYRGGVAVPMGEVAVSGVNGNSPAQSGPGNLVDGTLRARWTDLGLGGVQFDFGGPIRLNGYQFGTAENWNIYDPVSWRVEGSVDGDNWVLLHTVNDHPTTETRFHYDKVFTYPALVPASALEVFDPNQAPEFQGAPFSFSIHDNAATGAEVGTVVAVDPEGDPVAYAITGGNASGAFSIDSATGVLSVADASALVPGNYSLEIGAQDNGSGVYELASGETTVSVEVIAAMALVTPGSNEIHIPSGVGLLVEVVNNILPETPVLWTQEEGPDGATAGFDDSSALAVAVTFPEDGSYLLRCATTDEDASGVLELRVHVGADAGDANVGPLVDAGTAPMGSADVALGLSGSVDDDGMPDGSVVVTWSTVSGPGEVVFGDAETAATTATFPTGGTYVLRLTADDGEIRTFSEVEAFVSAKIVPVDSWRVLHFGADAGNLSIAGDLADPDGDGLVNLLEQAFGFDPNAASQGFEAATEDGFLSVVYRQDLQAAVTIGIEVSVDGMTTWQTPADAVEEIVSDDGVIRVIKVKIPHDGDTAKFLRIRVTR